LTFKILLEKPFIEKITFLPRGPFWISWIRI
jgi:hypothetical protein